MRASCDNRLSRGDGEVAIVQPHCPCIVQEKPRPLPQSRLTRSSAEQPIHSARQSPHHLHVETRTCDRQLIQQRCTGRKPLANPMCTLVGCCRLLHPRHNPLRLLPQRPVDSITSGIKAVVLGARFDHVEFLLVSVMSIATAAFFLLIHASGKCPPQVPRLEITPRWRSLEPIQQVDPAHLPGNQASHLLPDRDFAPPAPLMEIF